MMKILMDGRGWDYEIIRSRNPKILDTCDYVIDVGYVYDPLNGKFDHHQELCCETFDDAYKTPLSSAGMIYKYFGKEIIINLCDFTYLQN